MRSILWIPVLFLLALCGCEELAGAIDPPTATDAGNYADSGQVSTDSGQVWQSEKCKLCQADEYCLEESCYMGSCVYGICQKQSCKNCAAHEICLKDGSCVDHPCNQCKADEYCDHFTCRYLDPCTKCTADQVCLDKVCVNKSDPCSSCTTDQVCKNGVCVDPCADWKWMLQHQWTCPGWTDSDIKLKLEAKQNACWISAKTIEPMLASKLVCDKESKGFNYFEPQFNETIHCVIIE